MKIFITSFLILALVYGSKGRSCGCSASEDYSPQVAPKDVQYYYHGESCGCGKSSIPYDVHVPVKTQQTQQRTSSYGYNVDVPVVSESQPQQRYVFDVKYLAPEPKPIADQKTYAYSYEMRPAVENKKIDTSYIFDSMVQTPVLPVQEQRSPLSLLSQVDRVLMPAKSCNHDTPAAPSSSCSNPSHTPSTCNCHQTKYNYNYKLPINYDSRYDSDSDKSSVESSQYLPDNNNNINNQETENNSDSDYWESEEENHDLKKSKRDVKPQVDLFSNLKVNPLSKLFKNSKPKPYRRYPKYRRNFIKKSQTPLSSAEQVRYKRIPNEESSPCSYSYQSCDPSKHTKQGCPVCYKCKCEPIQPKAPGYNYQNMKIPYRVAGLDETQEEPSKVMFQEFNDEAPVYTGLQQDMYKKYIKQVLSKYPQHMAKSQPTILAQQDHLMNFIGDLAKTNVVRPKITDSDHAKYKIYDEAVDFYKFFQGSTENKPGLGTDDSKPYKKRGTVLEVIELDPAQVQQFENMIKKESD